MVTDFTAPPHTGEGLDTRQMETRMSEIDHVRAHQIARTVGQHLDAASASLRAAAEELHRYDENDDHLQHVPVGAPQ